MMENRSHQCPICNKVTERGKDAPPKTMQKGACDHERDQLNKLNNNFLMDDDADVFGGSEEGEEELDENGEAKSGARKGSKNNKPMLVGKYPMTPAEKLKKHMTDTIYTQAQLPACKQHIFCDREQMQEEVQPEEDSTLPKQERWYITGSAFDKGAKISKEQKQDFVDNYQAYIKKDFPQRNIMEKKRKLAAGQITKEEFEKMMGEFKDSDVERYQIVKLSDVHVANAQKAADLFAHSQELGDWIEQSTKLSAKVWDERMKREKKEVEKRKQETKLQANQSNQGNQALATQTTVPDGLKQSLTGVGQQPSMAGESNANPWSSPTMGATALGNNPTLQRGQSTAANTKKSNIDYEAMMKPKFPKKTIETPTRKDKQTQETKKIEERAQAIVDQGIIDAMRNIYGPYDKEQKSGLEHNDDFYSKYRAGAGRLGANSMKNSGKKVGGADGKGSSQQPNQAQGAGQGIDRKATTDCSEEDPKLGTRARTSDQLSAQQQQSQLAAKQQKQEHKQNQGELNQAQTQKFLQQMNHRVIHAVPPAQAYGQYNQQHNQLQKQKSVFNDSTLPSVKSPGNKVEEDKDKNKNKYDFQEIVKQSNLQILSQAELSGHGLGSNAAKRAGQPLRDSYQGAGSVFPRLPGATGVGSPESTASLRKHHSVQQSQELRKGQHRGSETAASSKPQSQLGVGQPRGGKEAPPFALSEENQTRITQCKNILTNQRLYAETILVNARTGKRVKDPPLQAKQRSQGAALKGKTTFQQYQDNLFSQTSNNQIAQVLNQSKRYELSQLKEDFGIMKYIKKKYLSGIFSKDEGVKGEISAAKLQEIKQQYFEAITKGGQGKLSGDELHSSIFNQIQDVDGLAKSIYQEILAESKGLNVKKNARAYQYDQDLSISAALLSPQAINEAQPESGQATSSGKSREVQKPSIQVAGHQLGSTKEIKSPSQTHQSSRQANAQASEMTGQSRSGQHTDVDIADAVSQASMKKDANPEASAIDERTNDDERERKEKTSNNNNSSMKGESERKRQNGSNRQQREAGIRTASQRTAQTGQQSVVPQRKQRNVQQVYADSDYWYHKGVVLNQKQENEFALNCYNQALELNPHHQASIFNLACAHEKLKNYKEALKWFGKAISVKEDWPDAHYGLSLCSLKLERHADAVKHINHALTWCRKEYQQKVEKRRIRHIERERARLEALEKSGAAAALAGANTQARPRGDEESAANRGAAAEDGSSVVYSEDEDENDELYIDAATRQNDGVSTHIMYVHALCYRENKEFRTALSSYAKVMKRQHQIGDYEKMIEQENFKNLSLKIVAGPGFPGWKVDLYSHFQRMKLLKENNRLHMIDLQQYHTPKDGWSHDKIGDVIKDLQRVRFFNRFDRETLYQMMKKTDLRAVKSNNLLFLEKEEAAIVINGNLHLFTHADDVATPSLQAIYTPGDIIGNSSIDNGWSRNTHSWIIAYQDCDILVLNNEYVDYIWDKMKGFKNINFMAQRLKESSCFKGLTEQSIYTLAFDMMFFKKFKPGEKICPQSTTSIYNIQYQKKEKAAIDKFTERVANDKQYSWAFQQFLKQKNPTIDQQYMTEQSERTQYHDRLLKELVRRDTAYGKKKKQTDEDEPNAKEKEREQREQDEENEQQGEKKQKDIFTLSMPEFGEKLTPEQEEAERQIRKDREPGYAAVVKEYLQLHEIFRSGASGGIIGMTEKWIEQLEEHRRCRSLFPKDSGGIYILLDGQACVKNSYEPERDRLDPDDSKLSASGYEFKISGRQVPALMDVLGAERYLEVQGYSYYGNVYAQADSSVTCAFLKEEMLYLLPYYDLYRLKDDLEAKQRPKDDKNPHQTTDLQKIKDRAEKQFKKVLREINSDNDNFAKKVRRNQQLGI